jgi:subtilisin family serine protease
VLGATGALALAVAVAPLGAAAAPADDHGATSTWVVTTRAGAKVEIDGRRIGPRDVVVEATEAEAGRLARHPGVVAVELDLPAAADLPLGPDDADPSALLRIGAETAWAVTAGTSDVVVAVIDGGVDADHPDLAGRVVAVSPVDGCPALPDSLGSTDRTSSGHGTRVAGLVAGVGHGGVVVRSYTALGPDLRGSTADVAAALHCAIDDGVDVVNLSLTAGDTSALRGALARAEDEGVVVVAAAGNGGNGAHPGAYPAAYPTVVAVTSVAAGNGEERRAPFANGGPWVDLAAPGVGVLSTAPGGRWSTGDGTSYSAPLVAGAAALVVARAPGISPALVRSRLAATAEPLADTTVGRGLVDLSAAVRFAGAGARACAVAPAWVLDAFGAVHAVGGAPPAGSRAYWRDWDIARDLATVAGRPGGYVLDGFGALHAFGGAPALRSPAYHAGWDVAQAAERRADGSVVVLDAQGGLHVAGGGPAIGAGGPWWPGTDTARDLAVHPGDPSRAYVLDAFGGVHLAGAGRAAPAVVVSRFTPGRDLARRLVLLPDGDRGYVLDERGALHPWAVEGVDLPAPLALATAPVGDPGRGVVATPGGVTALTALTGAGAGIPAGDEPCVPAPAWRGADVARAVAVPTP